jgi:hypothetical protein
MEEAITKSFTATLIQSEGKDAAYIEFPFSVEEVFGTKGHIKVTAVFDGKAHYRGILANMGTGCHILIATKAVRAEIGKTFGEKVEVEITLDKAPRIVEVPEDVQLLLNEFPDAKMVFEKMSYSHKKENINWINEARKPETREKRKEKMLLMLLQKADKSK